MGGRGIEYAPQPPMLPWLFALLVNASVAQPSAPAISPYIARTWGTADGLPQNTVTAIVQTRDGKSLVAVFTTPL